LYSPPLWFIIPDLEVVCKKESIFSYKQKISSGFQQVNDAVKGKQNETKKAQEKHHISFGLIEIKQHPIENFMDSQCNCENKTEKEYSKNDFRNVLFYQVFS
jgi:hypothetical protein